MDRLLRKRGIGTFIPNSSPVIQAILKGEVFTGRAFVVNDWYLTAYAPLYINGKVEGRNVLRITAREDMTSVRLDAQDLEINAVEFRKIRLLKFT